MTHSMRHGLPVTDRMREAYELVTLHGTRLAAAERMGVSSVAVGQFVAAYCRRTGAAPPYTRSRPYALAARRIAEADDRAKDAALEVARLRAHVEWLSEQLDAERAPAPEVIEAADVVRLVRDLPRLWEMADPDQRREMVGLIYDRIVIEGGRFVEVIPTPYALARGLPALLPERIGGAGEPGRGPARRRNHAAIVVPVRGRRELLRAMRRTA